MADHFVDPAYQSKHQHDIMGGTPHLEDEDNYRWEHKGRHVTLSDVLFQASYPTSVTKEQAKTRPNCDY